MNFLAASCQGLACFVRGTVDPQRITTIRALISFCGTMRSGCANINGIKVLFASLFCLALVSPDQALSETLTHETIILGTEEEYEGYAAVIQSLTLQGYTITSVEETMLNRIRIISRMENIIRETIVSPSTGGIIRDATWRE